MPTEPRITVVGRDGCHLCDRAKAVVEAVDADLDVGWVEVDVDGDLDLHERYWDKIPVILVDGEYLSHWRVSESRLRAALSGG